MIGEGVKSKLMLGVAVAALAMLSAQSVLAQSADPANVGEVVVTAQRREEVLQKVPLSVSALTGSMLQSRGVTRLEEYFAMVPGFSYSQIGAGERNGQNLAIRGVANTRIFNVQDGTAAQTVGFYINDVPIQAVDNKLFDVGRVEILKGPQGTLYGQASLGGTVKIETAKPSLDRFQATVEGTGSSTFGHAASADLNAMVNVPLVEGKLAARAVAYHRYAGGYIDWVPADPARPFARAVSFTGGTPAQIAASTGQNTPNVVEDANHETTTGARLEFKYQPTDALQISPFIWYQDRSAPFDNEYDRNLNAGLIQRRFVVSTRSENFLLMGLPIQYSNDWATFTSVSGYYKRKAGWLQDLNTLAFNNFGGTASGGLAVVSVPVVRNVSTSYSQEFRVSSNKEAQPKWLDWVVGGSFYQEMRYSPIFWQAPGFNAAAAPGKGIPRADELIQAADQHFKYHSWGAFGDITVHFTDQLSFAAGVRYYDIGQRFIRNDNGALAPCNASAGWCNSANATQSESGFTPRFNLSYKPTDNNMLYVSAAEGFRAGGFNNAAQLSSSQCSAAVAATGIDPTSPGFKSDSTWQYEVGSKNSFGGGRFTLNGSAFMIDWTNLQQSIALTAFDPKCAFSATANVGTAKVKGFELEANARPAPPVLVGANVSYTHARIGAPPVGAPNRQGQPVQGVPDWSGSAYAQYDFEVLGKYNSYLRVDWQYVGKRKGPGFAPGNTFYDVKAYDVTNLRFGVTVKNVETILFLDNAFNKIMEFGALPLAGETFTNQVLIGRPRTAGVTVRLSY